MPLHWFVLAKLSPIGAYEIFKNDIAHSVYDRYTPINTLISRSGGENQCSPTFDK